MNLWVVWIQDCLKLSPELFDLWLNVDEFHATAIGLLIRIPVNLLPKTGIILTSQPDCAIADMFLVYLVCAFLYLKIFLSFLGLDTATIYLNKHTYFLFINTSKFLLSKSYQSHMLSFFSFSTVSEGSPSFRTRFIIN